MTFLHTPTRPAALQVEAIKSGVNPGLTMVVGPPGTGKTDTAVQIMHVLYHNFPDQRTLLIAHSNQVPAAACWQTSQDTVLKQVLLLSNAWMCSSVRRPG